MHHAHDGHAAPGYGLKQRQVRVFVQKNDVRPKIG